MQKKLFLALTIFTPALLIFATNIFAQTPTPSSQVDTNTNNINIQNTQNQTQTVTIGAVAAVPRVLPATGASPLALTTMLVALPLGFYLRRYPIG